MPLMSQSWTVVQQLFLEKRDNFKIKSIREQEILPVFWASLTDNGIEGTLKKGMIFKNVLHSFKP